MHSGAGPGNLAGTSFLYNGANAAQELSGSTVIANLLNGGVDEVFTRTDSSGSFTPLKDALGSTIALVDSSGNMQTSYTYDPFGGTSVTGSSNANEFQYTGRENEGNGLYFYRNRYYSPLLGRFINEDPAGYGLNFYAYADDDPIDFSDPFGLLPGGSAAPATPPSTAPNGGLQLIQGGKTAARFLPETAVEWGGAAFFFVFDAFVAYEDFDTFQAIMASNQAQDEEIWAQNRSSQDRTNQLLVQQKRLAGRYTPAQQRQIEHDRYKDVCSGQLPISPDPCSNLSREIDRTNKCINLMKAFDRRWNLQGRHNDPIQQWTNGLKKLKDQYDQDCTK
jgi:RHS repeat-associated protein